MKYSTLGFVAVFGLQAATALGYKDETHRLLSVSAYTTSRLYAPQALLRLGLRATDKFQGITADGPREIVDLLQQGAVSEDYRFLQGNVVTHFFDPANGGRGLNPCPGVCVPSPDWALEDKRTFGFLQDSSYRWARHALFLALRNDDDTQFGRLSEILGRVIHHLQDMAQPQHTRNDAHLGTDTPIIGPIFGSAIRAAYELDTDLTYGAGVEEIPPVNFSNAVSQNLQRIQIATPRDLWMTSDPDTSVVNGKGMAHFSNRNLVTNGTNFRGVDRLYSDPDGSLKVDGRTADAYAVPSAFGATLILAAGGGRDHQALCGPRGSGFIEPLTVH